MRRLFYRIQTKLYVDRRALWQMAEDGLIDPQDLSDIFGLTNDDNGAPLLEI